MENNNLDLLLKIIIACGSLFTGIATVFAFFHLRTIKKSIVETKNWNKLKTSFEFLNSENFYSHEKFLNGSFLNFSDRSSPLNDDDVEKLLNDESREVRFILKKYLNYIEDYCQAINVGVIDESIAKRMYYYKLNRTYYEMKPFIDKLRIEYNENRLLCELEEVIIRWNKEEKVESNTY